MLSKLIEMNSESNIKSINDCSINNLPCELLFYIFNLVDLTDHLLLRVVCKRWSTIIQNYFKLKELNIVNPYEYYGDSKRNYSWWFGSNAYNPKYNLYLYENKNSNNLKSNLFKSSLFINLKYLNLDIRLNDKFNFEIFDHFKQLVQLEILYIYLNTDKKILNLSNLNTLAIYNLVLAKHNLLIINCDKLENLLFCDDNLNKIKFNYPNTIINLSIRSAYGNLNELIIFKNLKILNCSLTDELNKINLELLINLKEINLYEDYIISETSKFDCKLLLRKSKKLNLEIYLNDIKLVNDSQIDNLDADNLVKELDDNSKSSIRSFNKYIYFYNSEKNNCMFTKLIDKILNNDNLNAKFNDINHINLDSIPYGKYNNHNFIYLISKFNNLRRLKLYNLSLNQNFYDSLPKFCPFLIDLVLFPKRRVNLNNLISKLNYLLYFETSINLELDFVVNYFKINKNFHFIKFRNEKREYEISRKKENQFKYEWHYIIKDRSRDYLTFEKLKSELLKF